MARIKSVRVAAASLNEVPLDWDGNKERIIAAIKDAKAKKASVLCFPELCISGYNCEDMFHAVHVHEMSLQVLSEIIPHTKNIIVAVGLPLAFRGGVYNVACLIANGEILGFAAKQHLASEGVHYEPRWFRSWPAGKKVTKTIFGKQYPLGDLVFDVGGLRIGFEICQDAWVAGRVGVSLAQRGVDLILNLSASHFAFGKFAVRKRFVMEACRAFGVGYIYTNCLGNSAGRIIYDGEALIAVKDKFLAQGKRFSYKEYQLSAADINFANLRMERARSANVSESAIDLADLEISADFVYPVVDMANPLVGEPPANWEDSENLKAEEFTRAVSLGLFDYMRKAKSHGFVVNLSGGADSASCALLVWTMVKLGVLELGLSEFKNKLKFFKDIQKLKTEEEIVGRILTCLYQHTDYSSETTLTAARELALAIGAKFNSYPIEDIVRKYIESAEDITDTKLSWENNDKTLQNIQARTRGPLAWLIANINNAVLISTSNRSEAAVGYTTMDGDTCGGLSPIGGIDKAYIMQWLKWFEKIGPIGIGNVEALHFVNSYPPTAELKPSEMRQTDEQDLMPYDLLDVIERKAIHDKRSPIEIFHSIKREMPEINDKELIARIIKFFKLFTQNQWKRERYAPSFHVDDQNLDPKSWCRFPILSGNFYRELKQLEKIR